MGPKTVTSNFHSSAVSEPPAGSPMSVGNRPSHVGASSYQFESAEVLREVGIEGSQY